MDGIAKKGYGRGREKGKKEFAESLAADLGVESIDELKKSWKAQREAAEQVEQESQVAEAKALRELRSQASDWQKRFEDRDKRASFLESRANAMLNAEVKSRLAGMGAIPEALDVIATIAAPQLDWAADGEGIEVFVDDDDGRRPSHESLGDYLERIKTEKPFLFVAKPVSGSAPQGSASQSVVPQHQPSGQPNFMERFRRQQNRPSD
jgi:hypothetical protein